MRLRPRKTGNQAYGEAEDGEAGLDARSDRQEPRPTTKNLPKGSEGEENSGPIDRDGMKRAIKELAELDEQFSRDCKRQRQQVESSKVLEDEEDGIDLVKEAFRPVLRNLQNDGSTGDGGQDDAGPEMARMGKEEAKTAARDIAKSTKETQEDLEETLGRQNERPPPLDSEYLPLPWQGRLGYVLPPPRCSVAR
jgi:hypothetical protein